MLGLSGEAVPKLSLDEVESVCRARGLDGQEVVVEPGQDAEELAARSRAAGARVIALRVASLDAHAAPALARASHTLAAPVSVAAGIEPGLLDRVVPAFEDAGGRLLLGHRTDLGEALATIATLRAFDSGALGLVWELDPVAANLGVASAVLLAVRDHLGAVRLRGSGPEQRDHGGLDIGALLGQLALSGYAAPIVLCPSSSDPALLERWGRWATSRGSFGCGSAVSARERALDVREVEPRDRLDTILGAYRALIPGTKLHLTVDHDPTCMYYMLEATEPARSFEFQIVENGPDVWRAEVTKR